MSLLHCTLEGRPAAPGPHPVNQGQNPTDDAVTRSPLHSAVAAPPPATLAAAGVLERTRAEGSGKISPCK